MCVTANQLSALLIVVFWIPLLVLHESGHALMAAALGWHVGQIVIGMGRTVKEFRVGTALVEIRLVPVEGFVVPVQTTSNLRVWGWKRQTPQFIGMRSESGVPGLPTREFERIPLRP